MEESEKTTALKKAYAEIILNTAKEAAARVMVSDKKAVSFQQDLTSTKDEALRLLVRLKHMIDAKTIEAEITSLNQQRRIDELEAQLHEAEDIITDLRTELKWVRDKLEKTRNNQIQTLTVKNTTEDPFTCQTANQELVAATPSSSGLIDRTILDTMGTLSNQSPSESKHGYYPKQPVQLSVSHIDDDSGLDMIIRSKEPDLHRNGCTQRVRALESVSPDENLIFSVDANDQTSIRKGDRSTEIRPNSITRCTVLALKARNMELEKTPPKEAVRKLAKARKFRRRKKRYRKGNAASCKSCPMHLTKLHQTSSLLHCKTSSVNGDAKSDDDSGGTLASKTEKMDIVKSSVGSDGNLECWSNFSSDSISIIRKGSRNRKVTTRDSLASFLMLSDKRSKPRQQSGTIKSGEAKAKVAENEAKIKPLPRLDPGFTLIRRNGDQVSGSANVTVSVKGLCGSKPTESAAEDIEPRDHFAHVKQEGESVENPVVPSAELNLKFVSLSSSHSQVKDIKPSEGSNESPNKAESNRVVKYTFQRKRKKGPCSDACENNSPEKGNVKRKLDEEQNNEPDSQNYTLMDESSRGSRRLAQVARQLISLSGKRP